MAAGTVRTQYYDSIYGEGETRKVWDTLIRIWALKERELGRNLGVSRAETLAWQAQGVVKSLLAEVLNLVILATILIGYPVFVISFCELQRFYPR